MAEVEALLNRFEAGLLPHERYAVSQGLVAYQYRPDDELPRGYTHCAYMEGTVERLRADAHRHLGYQLMLSRGPKAGPWLALICLTGFMRPC